MAPVTSFSTRKTSLMSAAEHRLPTKGAELRALLRPTRGVPAPSRGRA